MGSVSGLVKFNRLGLSNNQRTRLALAPIFEHCKARCMDPVDFVRDEYRAGKKTLKGLADEWNVTRSALTRFMDRNGIPRLSLAETQLMVAENPSPKQRAQRRQWARAGWDLARSSQERERRRIQCINDNPARRLGVAQKISRAKWEGGRTKDDGYVYIFCPDHPNAHPNGYLAEHRLVMEQVLGRLLEPGEMVHHINGVRDDNREENLMLFASAADHFKFHRAQAKG